MRKESLMENIENEKEEKQKNGVWIRWTKHKLKELYNELSITVVVKAKGMKCLDHVRRMAKTKMPNILLASTVCERA